MTHANVAVVCTGLRKFYEACMFAGCQEWLFAWKLNLQRRRAEARGRWLVGKADPLVRHRQPL